MTSPAYFNTAGRLIEYAMRDAGLLAKGQKPRSSDYAENLNRLNDLVNAWQLTGIKLFLLQDVTVTPVAGTQAYTMSPGGTVDMTKPMRIVDGYFLDASGNSRPLTGLAWTDWIRLSNRSTSGATNQYFVDKQPTSIIIKVFPVPDAATALGTFHFLTQTQATNFVSITDTSAFPPEWAMALRWGLADEICSGQSVAIMQRCAQRAAMYKGILEDWDTEDTPIRFTPNTQGHQGSFN